ncbi:MAG: glycosyltransferase family 9 protein [Saprospiraceae bacterium]|nr:glycosyltransferase family 9 protein [Saprospiraceae bacterium]
MKSLYLSVLEYNPYVQKIHLLETRLMDVIPALVTENFDYVVDLHNNYRSKKVSRALQIPVFRIKKERIGLWLLTNLGIGKFQRTHIVDRFLKVIQPLADGMSSQSIMPQFHPGKEFKARDLSEEYMVIAIGAAYFTKQIPIHILLEVINGVHIQCVLIGGEMDLPRAEKLISKLDKRVVSLVGKLNISESASIIQKARVVLAGDTGMMHIANALGTPLVAVFGSTHPMLGYSPYNPSRNGKNIVVENNGLSCRPCTKQGKHKCPKKHFKCMLELNSGDIIDKIQAFI